MNNIIKRISIIFLMICILIPQQTIILFAEAPDGADASKEQTVEQQAATEEQDQTATDAAAGSSAQAEEAKADKADNATADTKQEAAPAASAEEKAEAAEPQPAAKTETEAEDKAEPEAEVKMPAGSEKASTSEMDVNVSWDEGIFPEGVSMKVRKASKQEAMDAAQEMADEDTKIVDAIAVDISFYAADGTEVQPVSPEGVHVTLKAKRAVEGETHQVVHIDDKGIAEEVADADASAKKASFDSVGFSIYAIVGEDGKTADEEEVRRTYIFYYPGENGNPDYDTSQTANLVEWDKQIVKNGDILVEPGTPSLKDQPDSFFAGWYAEGSDTRMTFGSEVNDIPTAAGSEDETVNVYAKYSTKYAAIFRDDEGNIEHEVVGEAGDEISLNVEIPGIEDRGSRLTGWKLVETGTSYNLDDTYTFNITDKNVEFEPVTQTVRKIQFNANHEDASFTAPIYAAVGEEIPAVDDPTNTGYTFTGWYLDAECTQEFDIETGTVPAGDDAFVLYAGWDPEQVNFQVYVWGEVMDANGDPIPEGGSGRYAVKAEWTNQIEAGYKFTADEVMAEYQRGISDPDNLIDSSFDTNYYTAAFNFEQMADDTVIKGDGSTIINLYFDLKEFTFVYHPASAQNKWRVTDILHVENGSQVGVGTGNTYTFKAKLGQDITDLWPTFTYTTQTSQQYYSRYPVFGWRISPTSSGTDSQPPLGQGNFITHRHRFTKDIVYKVNDEPQEETNFWPHGGNNNTSAQLHAYYMEPVKEGVDYDDSLRRRSRNGIDYIEMPEYTEHFTYTSASYNAQKTINGYRNNGWERESSGSATRYFYYLPEEYEIIFHNYNHESAVTGVEYKSDISRYAGRVPNREETGLPDYYEFQGWYTDRQYQNEFNFEGAKMPANNLVLYAYWKPTDITITFDAKGGKIDGENTKQVTIEADSLVANPGTPVRDDYTFTGWGVEGDDQDRIDFTQRKFSEDTTVIAHWYSNRDKFKIKYVDYEEGHAVPTDENTYDLGSAVILKKSPVADSSHHFHGYYIEDYDPVSGKYLPGDALTINDPAMDRDGDGTIRIVAYHGNEEDEEQLKGIEITYHSNYPDGTVEQTAKESGLERNEEVTTKDLNTFRCDGYMLTGWNTKADGSGTQYDAGQKIFADKIGSNDLYGVWQEAPNVEYKVEHYKQDLNDPTKYTKVEADTETLIGTTGTSVTATQKNYTGFTFDAEKTGNQDKGTILADGSLVLKVYYSRNNSYKLTYKYVGATPAGAELPSPNPVENLRYEQEVTIATTPYKAGDTFNGYTFNGWAKEREDLVIEDGKVIMPARNVVLDGSWTPNTDTEYKVEHYFQNIDDDDEYTLDASETKTLTGTTGTRVTAAAETYEGFTFNPNAQGTVRTGTIVGYEDEEDMLVLKIYYDRNKYSVTYHYNNDVGGEVPSASDIANYDTAKYKYGATVDFKPDATAEGYTFTGWSTTFSSESDTSFTMPARDVTVSGGWIANDNTKYTVEYYFEELDETYKKDDSKTKTLFGKTGTTANAPQETYEGFKINLDADGTVRSGDIEPDGSLVLKLYYDREEYDVVYHYNSNVTGQSALPDTTKHKFGETVNFAEDATAPGYTFSGWSTTFSEEGATSFTMPARAVTVNGSWTSNNDTAYKVEYYFQNVENDNYTLDGTKTKNLTGTTGTNVSAPKDTFEGFTVNTSAEGTIQSGAIKGDGSLVLKLYYDRNKYGVTYHYNTDVANENPSKDEIATYDQGEYKYGATVRFKPDATAPGYHFSGWSTTFSEEGDESFTMPARDVVVSGGWIANDDTKYTVEYYFKDLEGAGYTKDATKTKTLYGTTGTTANADQEDYEGFKINLNAEGTVKSGEITGDGKLVLKLYYDREEYDVVYHYNSDVTGESALPTTTKHKFGETVNFAEDATAPGYTFSGWSTTFSEEGATSFTMPARAVTVNGSWTSNNDTAYKVEYYFQNVENDNYTLDGTKTKNLTGTTGTNVSAPKDTFEGFTVNTSAEGTIQSGAIKGDGKLVLKLYYDRNKYDVVYHYNNDVTGESALPATTKHKFGETVDFAEDATAPGYTFSGWSTTFSEEGAESFTMPARAVTVNGRWTANSDTEYTVEYYNMGLDGEYPNTPSRTVTRTMTTGETAEVTTPEAPEGFTFDSNADNILEAAVKGDGSTVLKLYFSRNKYQVSYVYSGHIPTSGLTPTVSELNGYTEQVYFGDTVTVKPDASADDYTFDGWKSTNVTPAGGKFTMPSSAVRFTGTFTPTTGGARYEIRYYTLKPNDKGTGTDDGEFIINSHEYELLDGHSSTQRGTALEYASIEDPHYAGYEIDWTDTMDSNVNKSKVSGFPDNERDGNSLKGQIRGDEDNPLVLALYLKPLKYTVTYNYSGESAVRPAGLLPVTKSYRVGDTVTLEPDIDPSKEGYPAGYTFKTWRLAGTSDIQLDGKTFTMPNRAVNVYGTFEARSDTKYTVEYYFQNVSGSGYTKNDSATKTLQGTTGTTVNAPKESFEGFKLNENAGSSIPSGIVAGDGSLVLKLYYDRETYDVTYHYTSDVTGESSLPATRSYRYGATVSFADDATAPGYTFNGWETTWVKKSESDTFVMPARNVTVNGGWTANSNTPYKVEYYFQNVENDIYTIDNSKTKNLTGTTGTTVNAPQDTFEGFTLDLENGSTVKSGTIVGFEQEKDMLVLKLYYKRNTYRVIYQYSNDVDGEDPADNEVADYDTTQYKYGATVNIKDAATAQGYVFSGWTTVLAGSASTFEMPARNVIVSGSWRTAKNTAYKVEYYLQNVDGTEYVKDDTKTKNLSGETGAIANAPQDTFEGFEIYKNHPESNLSGEILANGTQVLKVYYNRLKYRVIYDYSSDVSGETPAAADVANYDNNEYAFEEDVTIKADATAPGYDFNGWTTQIAGDAKTFNMPARNVLVSGSWTAKNDTKYKVEYYFQNTDDDDYTLDGTKTKNLTGTTGTTVNAPQDTFEGFTINLDAEGTKQKGTITGDGELVLKLYYDRNEYDVEYHYTSDVDGQSTLPTTVSYRYGQKVTLEADATAQGYTFSGWSTQLAGNAKTFNMPARNVIVTGSWTTNKNTPYKVEYYFQNVENDNYTLDDTKTKNLTGETDKTATASKDTFEGFTYKQGATGEVPSGTIASDGSLVLKLYYDRNEYGVEYHYNNDVTGETPLPATVKYRFGKEVTLADNEDTKAPGYTFSGWTTLIAGNAKTFDMPARNVTVSGSWTAKNDTKYKVWHYFEQVGGGYDKKWIENGETKTCDGHEYTGTTGTEAEASVDDYAGYTFNESKSNVTGTIKGDGSLELNIYYDRAEYNLTYRYEEPFPADAVVPDEAGHKYAANVYVDYSKYEKGSDYFGYTFNGWRTTHDDIAIVEPTIGDPYINMPARDAELVGSWTPASDTEYTIIHKVKAAGSDTYERYTAYTRTGETGSKSAYAVPLDNAGLKVNVDKTKEDPANKDHTITEANGTISRMEGTIKAGENNAGTTVFVYYYDRNEFKVKYEVEDSKGATVPDEANKTYGSEVRVEPDLNVDGYTFSGWTSEHVTPSGGKFTMPAREVVFTGKFTPKTDTGYTVEYYFQNVAGDAYVKDDSKTKTLKGTTEATVNAPKDTFDGFKINESAEGSKLSGQITGDGKLVLKVYYDRQKYEVIYHNTGKVPQGADSKLPETKEYVYGEEVTTADLPTDDYADYVLVSKEWEKVEGSDLVITGGKFDMPARDVNLNAKWAEDRNQDGVDDSTQKFKVVYNKGDHGDFADNEHPNLNVGETTPDFDGDKDSRNGKPKAQKNYVFDEWDPVVAEKVDARDAKDSEGKLTITYVATWKDDKNNNGIPDEDEDFPITYPDADKDEDEDGKPDEVTEEVPYGTKVQIDPNGGTWKGSADKQTLTAGENGEGIDLTEAPKKTDYAFVGWKKTDGSDGIKYVFTAQWKVDKNNNGIPDEDEDFPITYPDADTDEDEDGKPDVVEEKVPYGTTVTVDPNGGTWKGSADKQTLTAGENGEGIDLTEAPKKTDYAFVGWKKTNGTDGIKYVFTAQWKDDKNNNGIPDEDEDFPITYPDADTDEDEDGKPDVVEEKVPYGTIVKVDPNGGTWKGKTGTQTFKAGEDGEGIDLTEAPKKTDNVFAGWKKTVSPDEKEYTFTAQWKVDKNNNGIPDEDEDFPITYPDADKDEDPKDGKPDKVTENVPYGTNVTVDPNGGTWKGKTGTQTFKAGEDGEGIDLTEAPKKTDNVFAGWKKTNGTDGIKYVFTAQWKADKNNNGIADEDEAFSVVFKDGDDTLKTVSDLKLGDTVEDYKPEKKDYVFDKWTPEFKNKVDAADADKNGVITYKAGWKTDKNNNGIPDEDENFPITYPDADKDEDPKDGKPDKVTENVPYGTTVTVDPSGGTWKGSADKQTLTAGENGEGIDLTEAPKKTDYAFVGWKKTNGSDGIKYVFTAQWKDDKNNNGIPDEDEEFPITYPDADKDDDKDGKPDKVTENVPYGTTVTVDPSGGTWKGKKGPQTFKAGEDGKGIDLSEEPVWDRAFAGWKKTVSPDGKEYSFTAQWCDPVKSGDVTDPDGVTRGDPPVKKVVKGKGAPKNDKFTFQFKAAGNTAGLDKNPMPGDAKGNTITVKLAAGEEHEFGDIEFAYPGVYNYTITEVDDGQEGYTYDTSVYTVTYTVTQNGTELNCVRTFQKNGVDVTIATFEFDNTYVGDANGNGNSGNGGSDSTKGAKTGDDADLTAWCFVLGVTMLLMILFVIWRRREQESENL